tara:strand:- start:524 stop:682 length:159 start_codon:yes stop_codon:yes gene_type:complete
MPVKKKYTPRKKSTRGAGRSKRVVSKKSKSKMSKAQNAHFLHLMFGDKIEEE